jgi:serine/threonine protein phosphatase 1
VRKLLRPLSNLCVASSPRLAIVQRRRTRRDQPFAEDPLLKRLFQRPRPTVAEIPTVGGRPPRVPDGVRVYAIGDVHGRIDLLRQLEGQIVEDAARQGESCRNLIVYLGDYVDRGFNSREVIEHLTNGPPEAFDRVLLLGNHDQWLRSFLDGEPVGDSWVRFGGDATLLSYGVTLALDQPDDVRLAAAQSMLASKLPDGHRALLDSLEPMVAMGDYLFVHAGIRPGVPLAKQAEHDLIWIREPFLSWSGEYGKIVVHGHTVEEEPIVRRNRIGIDTGACYNGNLTCLVLEGTDHRFIATGQS